MTKEQIEIRLRGLLNEIERFEDYNTKDDITYRSIKIGMFLASSDEYISRFSDIDKRFIKAREKLLEDYIVLRQRVYNLV